jgi:hypothetical protein
LVNGPDQNPAIALVAGHMFRVRIVGMIASVAGMTSTTGPSAA